MVPMLLVSYRHNGGKLGFESTDKKIKSRFILSEHNVNVLTGEH